MSDKGERTDVEDEFNEAFVETKELESLW